MATGTATPSSPSERLFDDLIAETIESKGLILTAGAQREVQLALDRGLKAIRERKIDPQVAIRSLRRMVNAAVGVAQRRGENRNRIDVGVVSEIKADSDLCPNIFCLDKKESLREKKGHLTKAEVLAAVSDAIGEGVSRKQVAAVMATLVEVGHRELKKKGIFVLPGFAKFVVVKRPARPAREGINPFTKEKQTFVGKPSSKAIRARPTKAIKDVVR